MSADRMRMAELSVLIHLPSEWLMAMLRGWFDDSGDQDDPQHNCMSFGGYIGSVESWDDRFRPGWQTVLDRFQMPWLHCKEFGKPSGAHAELKKDPARVADFLAQLAKVIEDSGLLAFGSALRVADLNRFNENFGIEIDAYSLTLADILATISVMHPDLDMDLRLDRAEPRPYKKIDRALSYLGSDQRFSPCLENINEHFNIAPLARGQTFRKVLAVQAADCGGSGFLDSGIS
jgi:hypothetical protein